MNIEGTLTVSSGTRLVTPRIVVGTSGVLQVGTPEIPVSNVEIYLQHDRCDGITDPSLKRACLANGVLSSYGRFDVFGVPKTPWTLLVDDCDACDTLTVAECSGWAIGDRIAVSATGGRATKYSELVYAHNDGMPLAAADPHDNFEVSEATIQSLTALGDGQRCQVKLDGALKHLHRGSWMGGGRVPTHAEVINLSRSVLITGPPMHWKDAATPIRGGQGIVTAQMFGGTMRVSYARVENCGRVQLGRYCLHYHVVGQCHECHLKGNVVTRGVNKGITVHGTHHATVDQNVVYDLRGASIYIEDGNEVNNTISRNVLMCPSLSNGAPIGNLLQDGTGNHMRGRRCSLLGVESHRDSDYAEQSGIYALSPSNHIIGNRISGHENALFVNHQGGHTYGIGYAKGRNCVASMPFGRTEGNVFHNNAGFGWYVNVAFPTNVDVTAEGYVKDWNSCLPFNMTTGAENGKGFVVKDHVEYFNDFSMGAYDLGDATFENVVSAMSNKGLYWKTYRRGANSAAFARNVTFVDNSAHLEGPGGSGLVEFENLDLITTPGSGLTSRFVINHHCALPAEQTGGLCASHYVIRAAAGAAPFARNQFVSEASRSDAVILYDGASQFLKPAGSGEASVGALPTFETSACTEAAPWLVCNGMDDVRVVRIYSPDRGTLRVTVGGVVYSVPFLSFTRGKVRSNQKYVYTPPEAYLSPGGYTFLVRDNAEISIDIPTSLGPGDALYDMFTLEYADAAMTPETSIRLSISGDARLAGGPCRISSSHGRSFITPYGPLVPQSGAWWTCRGEWATAFSSVDFMNSFNALIDARTTRTCSVERCDALYSPNGRIVLDSSCPVSGGVGCAIGGEACCRLCDAEGFNTCTDRTVPYVPGAPSPVTPAPPQQTTTTTTSTTNVAVTTTTATVTTAPGVPSPVTPAPPQQITTTTTTTTTLTTVPSSEVAACLVQPEAEQTALNNALNYLCGQIGWDKPCCSADVSACGQCGSSIQYKLNRLVNQYWCTSEERGCDVVGDPSCSFGGTMTWRTASQAERECAEVASESSVATATTSTPILDKTTTKNPTLLTTTTSTSTTQAAQLSMSHISSVSAKVNADQDSLRVTLSLSSAASYSREQEIRLIQALKGEMKTVKCNATKIEYTTTSFFGYVGAEPITDSSIEVLRGAVAVAVAALNITEAEVTVYRERRNAYRRRGMLEEPSHRINVSVNVGSSSLESIADVTSAVGEAATRAFDNGQLKVLIEPSLQVHATFVSQEPISTGALEAVAEQMTPSVADVLNVETVAPSPPSIQSSETTTEVVTTSIKDAVLTTRASRADSPKSNVSSAVLIGSIVGGSGFFLLVVAGLVVYWRGKSRQPEVESSGEHRKQSFDPKAVTEAVHLNSLNRGWWQIANRTFGMNQAFPYVGTSERASQYLYSNSPSSPRSPSLRSLHNHTMPFVRFDCEVAEAAKNLSEDDVLPRCET